VPGRSSSPDERLRGLVAKNDDELPVITRRSNMTEDDKKEILSSDEKGAAKSTLGGAVAGAVVGTAVGTPVVRTLIGAVSGAVIGARKRRSKTQPTKRRTKAKTSPAKRRAPAKATAKKSKSAPKRRTATKSSKGSTRRVTKSASHTVRARSGRKRAKPKSSRKARS
jgi:hypothetical protein